MATGERDECGLLVPKVDMPSDNKDTTGKLVHM